MTLYYHVCSLRIFFILLFSEVLKTTHLNQLQRKRGTKPEQLHYEIFWSETSDIFSK